MGLHGHNTLNSVYIVPLDVKGSIYHFAKCRIHYFISQEMIYASIISICPLSSIRLEAQISDAIARFKSVNNHARLEPSAPIRAGPLVQWCLLGKSEIAGSNPTLAVKFQIVGSLRD